MVSMSSSSLIDSILARGTMMSCTVTAPTSNRLSRIERCFFGMKFEYSSTMVRISSGDSFATRVSSGRACREQQQRLQERVDRTRQQGTKRRRAPWPASASARPPAGAMPLGVVLARGRLGTISPNTMDRIRDDDHDADGRHDARRRRLQAERRLQPCRGAAERTPRRRCRSDADRGVADLDRRQEARRVARAAPDARRGQPSPCSAMASGGALARDEHARSRTSRRSRFTSSRPSAAIRISMRIRQLRPSSTSSTKRLPT